MWHNVRMRFPENVKRLRRAQKLSQERLADLVGVGKSYISMLERGQREPSQGVLRELASVLGVTRSDLLDESATTPSPIHIIGKVFAGPEGSYIDDYSPGAHPVLEPFETNDRVAVIVEGDSMLPRFRPRETLIFGPQSDDPTPHIGMEVMAALADGRRLVKVLRRGQEKARWDLYSINTTYNVIEGMQLLWVRPFEGLRV